MKEVGCAVGGKFVNVVGGTPHTITCMKYVYYVHTAQQK